MEYVGPAQRLGPRGRARIVRRRGVHELATSASGRVVAALSVGRSDDLGHARRLIRGRVELAGREDALADPGTDLAALTA